MDAWMGGCILDSCVQECSPVGASFYFAYIYIVFETIQLRNVSNVYYYIELTCYLCFLLC
jgi:hypothetical protein